MPGPRSPLARVVGDSLIGEWLREAKQFFDALKNVPILWGSFITVTFTGAAAKTVPHGLGRLPTGYLVIGRNTSAVLYDGNQNHTLTNLYLTSSAAGTFRLWVF